MSKILDNAFSDVMSNKFITFSVENTTNQTVKDVVLFNEMYIWNYQTNIIIDELEPNCTLRVTLQLKN